MSPPSSMLETLTSSSCSRSLNPVTQIAPERITLPGFISISFARKNHSFPLQIPAIGGRVTAIRDSSRDGSLKELDDSPVSVELQPICSEAHFDQVIAEAQQLEKSIIILWLATWCRKCIYLKPKLEKLAAEYHPRLRFYSVDVNMVSYKLVSRAGVTKMPSIQLWRDGKRQDEVIGGHKAHLVVNEVREMIESH